MRYWKKIVLILLATIVIVSIYLFNSNKAKQIEQILQVDNTKSFSLVVLPDTQNYAESYPEIFCKQTDWIVANKEKLNIVFVSQLGDIVDDGAKKMEQWAVASKCLGKLEGIVSYSVIPGNHDVDTPNVKSSGFKAFDATFPASRFDMYSWYGGNFENNRNNFEIITAFGMKLLFLNLEIEPSDEALAWANGIVKAYPDSYTIVTTHKYLGLNTGAPDTNLSFSKDGNVGYNIWKKLVYGNCSISMVLSGHYHGNNHISTNNSCGNMVHQILQDFQALENGGNGWLRIYTFTPDEHKVSVNTYSPFLDKIDDSEDNKFSFSI